MPTCRGMQAMIEFFYFFLLVGSWAFKSGCTWVKRLGWVERHILYVYLGFLQWKWLTEKTKAGRVRGPEEDSCSVSRLTNVLIIACFWKKATYCSPMGLAVYVCISIYLYYVAVLLPRRWCKNLSCGALGIRCKTLITVILIMILKGQIVTDCLGTWETSFARGSIFWWIWWSL